MATRPETSSGGIGLGSVLFVVFLVLRLTHVIDWSWWWITAPLWIPVGVVLLLAAIGGALIGLASALGKKGGKR